MSITFQSAVNRGYEQGNNDFTTTTRLRRLRWTVKMSCFGKKRNPNLNTLYNIFRLWSVLCFRKTLCSYIFLHLHQFNFFSTPFFQLQKKSPLLHSEQKQLYSKELGFRVLEGRAEIRIATRTNSKFKILSPLRETPFSLQFRPIPKKGKGRKSVLPLLLQY